MSIADNSLIQTFCRQCYTTDHEKAIGIAEHLYNNFKEIDVVKLAKLMGLEVNISSILETPAEIYYEKDITGKERFEIFAKKLPSLERQRFSIAHEIAHFCIHKDKLREVGVIDREGFFSLPREYEMAADDLAGKILMPQKCMEKFLREIELENSSNLEEKNVINIAKKFQVSKVAAAIRLREMGFSVRFV